LLRDDAERTRLADVGSALVRSRFDWDDTVALLEPPLDAYIADPVRCQRPSVDFLARDSAR
jgi:hypothetical protein